MPSHKAIDPYRRLRWSQISQGWEHGLEYDYWLPESCIEGKIPPELLGTLLQNGPGNAKKIRAVTPLHPLDGDGYVVALTFENGRVHLKSKFVRTKTKVEEEEEGHFIYPGIMGTRADRDYRPFDALAALVGYKVDINFREPANENVIYWGGKVIASSRFHLPYTLDLHTLNTIGRDTFGVLDQGCFCSQWRIDHKNNHLVGFALRVQDQAHLMLYEFDDKWNCIVHRSEFVDGLCYSNDFLLTDTYYIFHMTPFVKASSTYAAKVIAGLGTPADVAGFDPDLPCRIVLIPRDPSKATLQLDTDPCHIMYFTTVTENRTKQTIDFDAVAFDEKFQFKWDRKYGLTNSHKSPGHLYRYHIDIKTMSVARLKSFSHPVQIVARHPYRDGKQTFCWLTCSTRKDNIPYRDIIKYNSQEPDDIQIYNTWGCVSNICFAPKYGWRSRTDGNEDEGWLIGQLYIPETHLTEIIILDARHIDEGPVARIRLLHHLPYTLHSTWTHNTFRSFPLKKTTKRQAKL